jgi:hypothetical protein
MGYTFPSSAYYTRLEICFFFSGATQGHGPQVIFYFKKVCSDPCTIFRPFVDFSSFRRSLLMFS